VYSHCRFTALKFKHVLLLQRAAKRLKFSLTSSMTANDSRGFAHKQGREVFQNSYDSCQEFGKSISIISIREKYTRNRSFKNEQIKTPFLLKRSTENESFDNEKLRWLSCPKYITNRSFDNEQSTSFSYPITNHYPSVTLNCGGIRFGLGRASINLLLLDLSCIAVDPEGT